MLKMDKPKFKVYSDNNVENLVFSIVVATLFASCLCHWMLEPGIQKVVKDSGVHISFQWVFWIAAAISVFYIWQKKIIRFDFELVILAQTFVLAAILDYQRQSYEMISYAWILPIAYIIGKLAIGQNKKIVNYRIIILFFAMAIPTFICSTLDFGVNWVTGWSYGTEHWNTFFTGLPFARTTYEYGFVLMTSAVGFAIYYLKKHPVLAFLIIGMHLFAEYLLFFAQGRQNPILLILTIMMTAFLIGFDRWSYMSDTSKKRIYGFLIACIVLIVFLAIAFRFNVAGLHDLYKKSYWSDGGFLKNERIQINLNGLRYMMENPIDPYVDHGDAAGGHSLILGYGGAYGVTIYGLLTLFRTILFIQAARLAFRRSENAWIKYLLVPGFVCINIYYTMEPNAAAHRYFWMLGLFISGMIKGWLELEEKDDSLRKIY